MGTTEYDRPLIGGSQIARRESKGLESSRLHAGSGSISTEPAETAGSSLGKTVVSLMALSAGIGAFWFAHTQAASIRCMASAALAAVIAVGGWKKKSLDVSGAISAFFVGWITCFASFEMGITLIAFFISSSLLTRLRSDIKKKTDEEFKEGGQRNVIQVLANGGLPTALAALYAALPFATSGPLGGHLALLATACMSAFVAYYACCCGDTWASELGVLSKTPPRLVTTFRVVPAGTNGGITTLGTAASAAGGLFIGASFFLSSICAPPGVREMVGSAWLAFPWWIVPLGLAGGAIGSLIDSLLGATIQFSGYDTVRDKISGTPGPGVEHISGFRILNNHAVNFVSAVLTAALALVAVVFMIR
eukprot:CAMPEP_0118935650 /NCGR_PEP_ID=MMETSP1169-20130426/15758_1 /TAXON_ID=36882 /ORGANISM="Pyramimonas obovata, Strain CCMP722" /LENGTH=362 /DNA_ID=CAMNT_0006878709 /DNA_START=298 /DNA_END=1386 /DNA_ORIENTATION=+